MVNLYGGLIAAVADLSKSAHSVPVISAPLFPRWYDFPRCREGTPPGYEQRTFVGGPSPAEPLSFRHSGLIYGTVKEQEIVFGLAPSVVCERRFYEFLHCLAGNADYFRQRAPETTGEP